MQRKSLIISLTMILMLLITIIGVPKLFVNKKEVLPEVKLKDIEKNKTFAIMVSTDNNGYKAYESNEWPKDEDDYYYVKSECIDNNGKVIDNAISYNEENNTASLTTNSTVYCTLYFDKYNYMKVITEQFTYGNNLKEVGAVYMSSKVRKVEFVDETPNLANYKKDETYWDISDTSQGTPEGSVIAWLDPIQNDDGYYTLYIGSKKQIRVITLDRAFCVHDSTSAEKITTSLETINFNNKLDTSKTTSFSVSFAWNDKLTQINGTENWDTSNVTNFFATFAACQALSDFNFIKNWQITNKATELGGMFETCYKFDSLNLLQNWDVSNVETMQGMFSNCTNLVDINGISNWNVSNVTNMRTMFYGCTSLQNINLSTWDTKNVINVEGMFYNCTKLNTLNMSNATFTQIQDSNNYQNMFYSVPSTATIIVKDENQRNWLITNKTILNFKGNDDQIKLPNEV